MIQIKDNSIPMDDLLKDGPEFITPELGTLIKGTLINKTKNRMLLDLNGVTVGIISGKETHDSYNTIKVAVPGDEIIAVVVEEENEDGMIVLSLRKASQQRAWNRFLKAFNEGEIIEVVAQEVNKGGLLLEVDGIKGFIPVSQLAPLHYPRVNNANSAEIVSRLERLIGTKFQVKIINIDKENGKLILSEKEAMSEERISALSKLKPGMKVKGKISGVVKFGIFVTFEGLEGLVHISEIAWGHVKDTNEFGRVGDEIEVLVIGVDGEKISLSLKRLVDDPWLEAAKVFKMGQVVKGVINRITQFGAFMKLTDDINGLIHLSEISHSKVEDPNSFISIGQEVEATVIALDLDEHRIGLSIKAMLPEEKKKEVEEKDGNSDEKKSKKEDKETKTKEDKETKTIAGKETKTIAGKETKSKELEEIKEDKGTETKEEKETEADGGKKEKSKKDKKIKEDMKKDDTIKEKEEIKDSKPKEAKKKEDTKKVKKESSKKEKDDSKEDKKKKKNTKKGAEGKKE